MGAVRALMAPKALYLQRVCARHRRAASAERIGIMTLVGLKEGRGPLRDLNLCGRTRYRGLTGHGPLWPVPVRADEVP